MKFVSKGRDYAILEYAVLFLYRSRIIIDRVSVISIEKKRKEYGITKRHGLTGEKKRKVKFR